MGLFLFSVCHANQGLIDCMSRPCSDTFTIFDGTQLGTEIFAVTGPVSSPLPDLLNTITSGVITLVFISDGVSVGGGVFVNVAL